jgi:hypothetical protein
MSSLTLRVSIHTNPKRERGLLECPRLRFGLVSIPTRSVSEARYLLCTFAFFALQSTSAKKHPGLHQYQAGDQPSVMPGFSDGAVRGALRASVTTLSSTAMYSKNRLWPSAVKRTKVCGLLPW